MFDEEKDYRFRRRVDTLETPSNRIKVYFIAMSCDKDIVLSGEKRKNNEHRSPSDQEVPNNDYFMLKRVGDPVTKEEYEYTVEVTEQDRSIKPCELVIVLRSQTPGTSAPRWTYGAFIYYEEGKMRIEVENRGIKFVRPTHVRVFPTHPLVKV